MLDKNFVRENLDFVRQRLSARGGNYPIDDLVSLDGDWKRLTITVEELRRRRNQASEQIGQLRKEGKDTTSEQAQVKEISAEIKSSEEGLRQAEERLNTLLHGIPNLPHDSVPTGTDENANVEVRRWGKAPVSISSLSTTSTWGGPRDPGHGPCGENRRRALLAAVGRRRAHGTGPDQLHARRPYPGTRVQRGASAIHGQLQQSVRHRKSPQIRRRTCSRSKAPTTISSLRRKCR